MNESPLPERSEYNYQRVFNELGAKQEELQALEYVLRQIADELLPELEKRGLDLSKIIKTNLGNPGERGYEPPSETYTVLMEALRKETTITERMERIIRDFNYIKDPYDLLEIFIFIRRALINIRGDILDPKAAGYAPTQGFTETREAIAKDIKTDDPETHVTGADIIIYDGSGKIIPEVADVMDGELLWPSPGYPTWNGEAAYHNHGKSHHYKLTPDNRLYPDFDSLEQTLKENPSIRGIVVLPIGNPSSTVLSEDDLRRYIEIAKKYGVILISDNAYKDLTFNGDQPNFPEMCREAGVPLVELRSYSKDKCLAGIRSGAAIFHHPDSSDNSKDPTLERVKECLLTKLSPTVSSASPPQMLVEKLITDIGAEKYHEEHVARLKRDAEACYEVLKGLPEEDFEVIKPEGGMYLTVLIKDPDNFNPKIPIQDTQLSQYLDELEETRLESGKTVPKDRTLIERLVAETNVLLPPISGCCGPGNSDYQGFRVVIMRGRDKRTVTGLKRVVDVMNGDNWRAREYLESQQENGDKGETIVKRAILGVAGVADTVRNQIKAVSEFFEKKAMNFIRN